MINNTHYNWQSVTFNCRINTCVNDILTLSHASHACFSGYIWRNLGDTWSPSIMNWLWLLKIKGGEYGGKKSLKNHIGKEHENNTYIYVRVCVCVVSHVWLFVTPWTAAHQVPLSMKFPGNNTGAGCHFLLWGSSRLRDRSIHISCESCTGGQILYHCTTWEALYIY